MFSRSASRSIESSSVSRMIAGIFSSPASWLARQRRSPMTSWYLSPSTTDHDRLHQTEFADRVDQFRECFLVENAARLLRVRLDQARFDLEIDRTGRLEFGLRLSLPLGAFAAVAGWRLSASSEACLRRSAGRASSGGSLPTLVCRPMDDVAAAPRERRGPESRPAVPMRAGPGASGDESSQAAAQSTFACCDSSHCSCVVVVSPRPASSRPASR